MSKIIFPRKSKNTSKDFEEKELYNQIKPVPRKSLQTNKSKVDVRENQKISKENAENDKNYMNLSKGNLNNEDQKRRSLVDQKTKLTKIPSLADRNRMEKLKMMDQNEMKVNRSKGEIETKKIPRVEKNVFNKTISNFQEIHEELMVQTKTICDPEVSPLTARPSILRDLNINLEEETEKLKLIEDCIHQINLKENSDFKPTFSSEEYRSMYSNIVREDYSESIVQNLIRDEETFEDCLINHKINERMRTRMIDWMIEVLTNYKCDDHTFFIAVSLMDNYFKSTKTIYQPADLHLIGITCMFMASKFHEIYPLRLNVIYEKIAHGKISQEDVKLKESKISNTLQYIIGKPTIWEFINIYIEEIFYNQENNNNIKDERLAEINKKISSKSSSNFRGYPKNLYTSNMLKLLKLVVIYLAKMNTHDYSLNGKKPSLLAASTIFVSMKICEQINKEQYVNEYFYKKLTEISKKEQSEIIKCAQKILNNAQNFDSLFHGLENLKKVHFNSIIEVKETK